MNRLKNKVAVITGGNSGIGKGIAQSFLKEGAKVVIFGRNPETLKQTQSELDNQILAIQGDLTNTEDLHKLYQATQSQFGKIDILVANSGVGKRLHVEKVTEEDFDYMVNINYRGVFFTVKYALDYINNNASIILISSLAATVTLKNQSVYASAKAAISKFAQNFAYDLAYRSIRVNSISPGYIETPLFTERLKADPDYLNRRKSIIPLGRIGQPEDIGQAAVFLASDESTYITGVNLLVDGGYAASFRED